ncbi:hypothetical protein SprV_0702413900 [Sparganum proliferum]
MIIERTCRPEYELFNSSGNKCISYKMLQTMPDRILATARRPAIYSIYPQDVPLAIILQAVKNHRPVPVVPINNPKFVLIHTSRSVCNFTGNPNRTRYELIIIVKSAPTHEARRSRLRRLINRQTARLKRPVGLLFSLGLPPDSASRSLLLDAISYEAAHFDDILLADFTDTYYNLTLKTMLNLRYAHVVCQGASPLFAFMDDDHCLNLSALLAYFHTFDREEENKGQLRQSVFGHIYDHSKVIRQPGNKWAVTRREMPFYMYPDYAAGLCYFIGAEAVESLSIATAFIKFFSLEDTYVGLVAAKMGIKMHTLPGVHLHGPELDLEPEQSPLIASLKYFKKHMP